jgi:hypothetical protein
MLWIAVPRLSTETRRLARIVTCQSSRPGSAHLEGAVPGVFGHVGPVADVSPPANIDQLLFAFACGVVSM